MKEKQDKDQNKSGQENQHKDMEFIFFQTGDFKNRSLFTPGVSVISFQFQVKPGKHCPVATPCRTGDALKVPQARPMFWQRYR